MGTAWLVGFMGAGKTSVGRELARILGWSFVDLDGRLSEQFGVTIREFFVRWGEAAFREQEAAMLCRVVEAERAVVATGGGTFCIPANRELIHSAGGMTVFLDVPWEVILSRLPGKNFDRPVFGDHARARALFDQRQPLYRHARMTVTVTGDESSAQVAQRIAVLLAEGA